MQVGAGQAGDGVGGGGAGEHVVVGRGRGRERMAGLDRAEVGQAAGGLRPGMARAGRWAGRQRVGAAQRRVGRRCSRSGTMPSALSWPPPVAGSMAAKMGWRRCSRRSPEMLPATSLPKTLWPLLTVIVAGDVGVDRRPRLPATMLLAMSTVTYSALMHRCRMRRNMYRVVRVAADRAVGQDQRLAPVSRRQPKSNTAQLPLQSWL